MLHAEFSRARQRRLLEIMSRRRLDAVVVGSSKHVYYLSAHRPFWLHHAAFALTADARSLLICANSPAKDAAADEIETFDATWDGTQRQEQPALVADHLAVLADWFGRNRRIGLDASPVTAELLLRLRGGMEATGIEEDMWQLRRRKDADELALMKTAIACTKSMYERARQIIEPGIPETHVFSELHAAAVEVAGEPLSDLLGNDYACAVPGGPPRGARLARAGELYILDLGPAYRGYFSDNCRAIAVDRKPTETQLKAWDAIAAVFPIIERHARPGMRCNDLYARADAHLRDKLGRGLTHHLGHGVGLEPQEFPHLNPRWDDSLEEGEIFTVEPGIYGPELAGGIRLENQYLVTAGGVENLTPFPLELA
jgi:Xaa-Pro aminopeptidase